MRLLICNVRSTHKIELFLGGLQYAKSISVLILIFLHVFTLYAEGFPSLDRAGLVKTSLLFQTILLCRPLLKFITILRYPANSGDLRRYTILNAACSILLSIFIIPALVFGSLCGFFRSRVFSIVRTETANFL
jgi:p-aminobenzoyl-glutamate transporter AbgT